MDPIYKANWIKPATNYGDVCPVFKKEFKLDKKVLNAKLYITALGVYEAKLNGKRVGDYVLAPGWTSYKKRLQYQEYDITGMLDADNKIEVTTGKGWCLGRLMWEGAENFWFDKSNPYKIFY